MDDIEEIRRKKLEQLKELQQEKLKQIEEQEQEGLRLQQQIQMLENVVKQKMTREALQRYGNLKTAHPEKAVQLLVILGQILQTQKIDKIDDKELREILIRLSPPKKETKIIHK